jgi:aspartate/tyrosine/aromatic aminotransferase
MTYVSCHSVYIHSFIHTVHKGLQSKTEGKLHSLAMLLECCMIYLHDQCHNTEGNDLNHQHVDYVDYYTYFRPVVNM